MKKLGHMNALRKCWGIKVRETFDYRTWLKNVYNCISVASDIAIKYIEDTVYTEVINKTPKQEYKSKYGKMHLLLRICF